jgi:hypothetical protein
MVGKSWLWKGSILKYIVSISEGAISFCLHFREEQLFLGGNKKSIDTMEQLLIRLGVAKCRWKSMIDMSTFRVRYSVIYESKIERKELWLRLCVLETQGYHFQRVNTFGRKVR